MLHHIQSRFLYILGAGVGAGDGASLGEVLGARLLVGVLVGAFDIEGADDGGRDTDGAFETVGADVVGAGVALPLNSWSRKVPDEKSIKVPPKAWTTQEFEPKHAAHRNTTNLNEAFPLFVLFDLVATFFILVPNVEAMGRSRDQ